MKRRKDGRYVETITINGKRKFIYGKSKAEVAKKLKDFDFDSTHTYITFAQTAEEFARVHFPTVSVNTLRGYKPALKRAVDHLGNIPIENIKPKDVNKFLNTYIRTNHPARKTAATQLMILNLVFRYAVTMGYIMYNPAREITLPKGLDKTRRTLPSDSDIAKIESDGKSKYGILAMWILYTGLRRGEILALTWEDVNLFKRTITVNKAVYYVGQNPHIKQPKTLSGIRTVSIPDALLPYVKPSTGLVFPSVNGGLMHESEFTRGWNSWAKELDIDVTPHQLRHAYASMLYENDINVKDSQRLLGHAQASTTQDIYTHIRKQHEQVVNDKILKIKFGS